MNATLTSDRLGMRGILDETVRIASDYFNAQQKLAPAQLIDASRERELPATGLGALNALKIFESEYVGQFGNSAGPRYFGFVTGGSTPASVAGDWLVSTFDQNALGTTDSIAAVVEHQTISLLRQLLGLEPGFFGTFVTGATMSNMVGLCLGRQWVGEQAGIDLSHQGLSQLPPIPVFSATPHSSIMKALSMSGMGRNSWQKVNTLDDREAIDVNHLEQLLASSNPAIVVANAGTVNTVDFDDIATIAALKKKYRFWLHVDAAFGGFAGASPKYKHLVAGINEADSVTVDAHKWLNVPYDAAMQFTRHPDLQLKVFQNGAAYLTDPEKTHDLIHYTPENSRRFRALPAWFSLMAYGKEGHTEIVERSCAMAHKLGDWISKSNDYRLLAPVRMNVVCFSFKQETITQEQVCGFVDRVRDDGKVFFTPTVYKGVPAIRAAFSNWLTSDDDVEITINVLKKIKPV